MDAPCEMYGVVPCECWSSKRLCIPQEPPRVALATGLEACTRCGKSIAQGARVVVIPHPDTHYHFTVEDCFTAEHCR